MSSLRIPEIDTSFLFVERPEAIPGDLRPLWRMELVLLMLYLTSRGGKSSFGRLHVLNWALRNQQGQHDLIEILEGRGSPDRIIVRLEPSLNRAIDFAHGENLIKRVRGNHIELTNLGDVEARRILEHEELFKKDREFLAVVGKRLTEKLVTVLFKGQV